MCSTCKPSLLSWLWEKLEWRKYKRRQYEMFLDYLDAMYLSCIADNTFTQEAADEALAIREEAYEQAYARYVIKCRGLGVVPREPLDY